MASPTKTSDVFFQFSGNPIVEVAANTVAESTELAVPTDFAAQLYIYFAPTATSAITVGPALTIESTPFAAGDAGWMPVIAPIVFEVATPNSSGVDGTEAATSTVIEETVTTGLTFETIVFFKNSTLQNSEWGRVISVVTNTSFTLLDGLTNAQTGSTWFNSGQFYRPIVDFLGIKRIRAVLNNNRHATARACALRVGMVKLTGTTA